MESDEYNISINFDAKNEFILIKQAFDTMLLRLHDAKQERKNRQLEMIQILSDISHDLRTPVTKIRGLVQAILSNLIEMQLDYTVWERKDYSISISNANLSECLRDVIITMI